MEKRDNYNRCKQCGLLSADAACILDEVKGFQCPNGCEESFEQPPYEPPINQ